MSPFYFMADYRKIWKDANGPIPLDALGRSYEIHHIDGNKENNDLNNLMCISIEEHYLIHYQQKDYAACNLIADRLGNISFYGWNHSEEIKRKISEANKGKVLTEEHKRKLSELKKGKSLSEDHKRKMRKSRSEDAKNNIRESRIGKKHSEETKEKMKASHKGKKHSEETKQKISKVKKSKINAQISPLETNALQ